MVTQYEVRFGREASASLSRLDKPVAQRVLDRIKWLSLHIDEVNHKALSGHLSGAYKLRVGDYRVVYDLRSESSLVIIRLIAHRSEVYRLK